MSSMRRDSELSVRPAGPPPIVPPVICPIATLRTTLPACAGRHVHVVGDVIVDTWTICTLLGTMTKRAALSVQTTGQTRFVGGAGIVAKHLRAAGARVTLTTLLGDDALGAFARRDLEYAEIDLRAVTRTPTPEKERFDVMETGPALQVERWAQAPIDDRAVTKLAQQIAETRADIVVFSDFRHGLFSKATIPTLRDAIPVDTMRVADSQLSSRWGMILDFQDFDLITPNEREARFALADPDLDGEALARALYRRAGCRSLILTMGARGALALDREATLIAVPALAETVVDPVGAGDALLAYATLGLMVSGDVGVAAWLGSIAAALACEHVGNIPVTPADIDAKLESVEAAGRG